MADAGILRLDASALPEDVGSSWATPIPAAMPRREIIARAIYRSRPFRTAQSGAVMDPYLTTVHEFDFDGAPDFYRSECFELADAIVLDLALAEQGETRIP